METADDFEGQLAQEMLSGFLPRTEESATSTESAVGVPEGTEEEMAEQARIKARDALLAEVSFDMLSTVHKMGVAVKDSLEATPITTESARRLEPALNNYHRFARQAERLTQLESRLTKENKQAEEAKRKLQATVFKGHL